MEAAASRLRAAVCSNQLSIHISYYSCPAAFGRLCVETIKSSGIDDRTIQPPSGGCVLKL